MIGSYLRETDTKPRYCYACQTQSATNVCVDPIADLAPENLLYIHGTRCDACGDVRLYQLLKDDTTDSAIREELDVLAMMLTKVFQEGLSDERH